MLKIPITNTKVDTFMDNLSDENNLIFDDIEKLITSYENWIDIQKKLAKNLDKNMKIYLNRTLENVKTI